MPARVTDVKLLVSARCAPAVPRAKYCRRGMIMTGTQIVAGTDIQLQWGDIPRSCR